MNDRDDNSYVQFAVDTEDHASVYAEAVGDRDRAKSEKLSNDQKSTLKRLEWKNPSPTSSGNYWREFPESCCADGPPRVS